MDKLIELLDPAVRGWWMLATLATLVLGLLFERMWLLASMKRDIAEIKEDVGRHNTEISDIKRDAHRSRAIAVQALNKYDGLQLLLQQLAGEIRAMPGNVAALLSAGADRD